MLQYSFLHKGFTLIELSIVLVIIGLIVGGIVVGRDLIRSAEIQATITQVQQFQQAINTFRGKYDTLPGDMNAIAASSFGFLPRGSGAGNGDGNGLIQGNGSYNIGDGIGSGELGVLWRDMSQAKLIAGSFTTANFSAFSGTDIKGTSISNYLPPAKLGRRSYVYVWSAGQFYTTDSTGNNYTSVPYFATGPNYFGISFIDSLSAFQGYPINGTGGVTFSTAEAFAIDKKIDDGFPMSGNVLALYLQGSEPTWGDGPASSYTYNTPPAQTSQSPTTCFDNGGTYGALQQYSITYQNGRNINCGLSFKFQ